MLTHDATNQSAFIAFLYHARSEEAKDENQTICIHAMDWADLFIKRIYGYVRSNGRNGRIIDIKDLQTDLPCNRFDFV